MRLHPVSPLALALLVAAAAGSGCTDTTNLAAGTGQNVSLSFSGRPPAGLSGAMSASNALGDTLVQGSGTDTLRITSAEVVLRKISLERASVNVNCDSVQDETACEEFTVGPQLVSLPLAPGATVAITVALDSGTYRSVQFKIHKPGGDSLDLLFKAAHPDFATISIRVRGIFNGTPFTYTSTLDQGQEYDFVPPLQVDASGSSTNLTIRVDLTTWFKQSGSGALIDPSTANPGGANEGVVKVNIRNSVKAFEDRDHNGDERDG
jgi:hypothetical protein